MERKHLWLLVFILFVVAVLTNCGAGSSAIPPQNAKAEFLYSIGISPSPPTLDFALLSFTVDPTSGALTLTSNTPLAQPTLGIAVRPDVKFLYVATPQPGADFIDIYSIDAKTGVPTSDGAFSLSTICPFCPPQSGPGSLTMNSTGSNLFYGSATFGAMEGIGALTSNSATGALNMVPGSPFSANQVPEFVVVHPSGKFLFTEDTNGPQPPGFPLLSISGYSIDGGTSALTPLAGSPFVPPANAESTGFVVHPSGKFLYASSGSAMNGILAWSVDAATGALTPMAGSPFQAGAATLTPIFDPSGNFLYASGLRAGIYGFSVDTNTGTLSSLPGSPFSNGSLIGSLVVDPSGKFVLAEDGPNKAITEFGRDVSSGILTATGTSVSVAAVPGYLTIVPAP